MTVHLTNDYVSRKLGSTPACLQPRKVAGEEYGCAPCTRFHNVAMPPPQMFTVRITFNADDPDTAERLSAAFRGGGPFLLRGPVAVKAEMAM